MQNRTDDPDLIQAFFDALDKRDFDQCQAVWAQLDSLARHEPAYAPWCAYFQGILANERDRDWAEAERIFGRLTRTDLDPSLRGRVLLALGVTYEYQGRWTQAIRTYEEALALFAELQRPVDQAKVWKNMTIACRRGFTQGDFGPQVLHKALTYCRQALAVLDPILAPSPDVAWLKGSVWNTLGLIYRAQGQWDQALACYEQDLAICESLGDDYHYSVAVTWGNIGEVYHKKGRGTWPQALEAYRKALHIFGEFDEGFEKMEVLANLGFLHQEMGQYESALEHYEQAIHLIEALRAGVSSEPARAGFFATTTDVLANTVLLCLEMGHETQAFDYVECARSRAFLDALSAGSPKLSRQMAATPMTLGDVQAALPANALLIEYFSTGLVEAREGWASTGQVPERHRFPPSKTLIFAVTRERLQVHDAFLSPNDLLPQQLDSVVERHFLKPNIRQTLYRHLIAPIEELLRDRQRLYIVPHGPLHYIPFQALIASDGETLLREGGPPLIYAPSATILFHGHTQAVPAPSPCLAVGYNYRGKTRLRLAEEEAHRVAQLTGGQVLSGPAPIKNALYREAADHRVLHFSCHGAFAPQSPLNSALHLTASETLTALDVLEHLRLRCDLVTLSACESGLSRVRRGDELVGLIRAFKHAGAPVLLSTLWRVDERSTLILMERFYQKVRAGAEFAAALQEAQIYLKNLSRQEVQKILARLWADQIIHSASLTSKDRNKLAAPAAAAQDANIYLKGGGDSAQVPSGQKGDDKIFSDPFYWAPFVLVGDRELGILREG